MTPCTDRKHQAMKDDGYAKCWDCGESFYAERKPPVVASDVLLGDLKSLQRYECTIVHEKDSNGDYVLWEDIQRLIDAYTPNPKVLVPRAPRGNEQPVVGGPK